jgi:hypothetical protein
MMMLLAVKNMRKLYFSITIIFILILAACAGVRQDNETGELPVPSHTPAPTIAPTPTPAPVYVRDFADAIAEEVLETLADPGWEWRMVGTDGNIRAGEYLAGLLEDFGYSPYKGDSFFMPYEQRGFDYERFALDFESSFTAYNIVGVIRGADSTKAWVLSAHFDGLNNDENATAAYDNASGCAALAAVAARLAIYDEPFERDIIICFFNGEELGLGGSRAFVEEIWDDYEEITNINIDCIGGVGGGPLILQFMNRWFEGWNERNSLLYDAVREILNEYGVEHTTDYFLGLSDHASFDHDHMTAVMLAQEGALEIAHSYRDVIENVSLSEIIIISDIVYQFVIRHDGRSFLR